MTMNNEIEKLCSEIKPETLRAYAGSKGWKLSRKIDDFDLYFNKDWEYGIFIPFDDETLRTLSEAEDRPILAILFDLWRLQNPDENDLTWLGDHLKANGLEKLGDFAMYILEAARTCDTDDAVLVRFAALACERDEKDKRIEELESSAMYKESQIESMAGIIGRNEQQIKHLEAKVKRLRKTNENERTSKAGDA